MALQLSERRKRRSGGWVRGEGRKLRENVLRLVVMATGWLTMLSPMLSQGIRQRCTVCVQRFWTPSRFRRNMPSHAAFARVDAGTPRFARRHACCYALLRHALSKSPPTPSRSPSLNGTALVDIRETRPRGQEGQTAVQERKSLNARCVQNLFHARTLIFTCFL